MATEIRGYAVLFLIWLISTILIRAIFSKARSRHLPPSPLSLPIIGHLHLLRPIPHQALDKLSKRFGPLFHLSFGSVPCVVVSSPEMAKEFLKAQEMSFCNRPSTTAIRSFTYGGECDFSFAPYGPYWKFMKKITMTKLLGGQTVDQFVNVREEEYESFLKFILQKSCEGKEAINIGDELMTFSNNIISRMTMGKRCSTTDDEAGDIRNLLEEVGLLTGEFNFQDYIWFCKNIDVQGIAKRVKEVQGRLDAMMESILKEHEVAKLKKKTEKYGEVEDDHASNNRDLVDILMGIMEDENAEMKLSRESVKAFILEMFTTGTATSASVIQWALAEVINHPNIFGRAREEIDCVIGKSRLVKESDIPNLPYLQAIVKEALRLHPSGPIFAREATQDCNIGGYHIPAKTRILINAWTIARDSRYWENPTEFQPERFMSSKEDCAMNLHEIHESFTAIPKKSGANSVDVRGQHYQLLPFGSGRRGCPGTNLALLVIQTTLACLIQCFDWRVINGVDDDNKVDTTEAAGITILMARPFLCVPVARITPFLSSK